MTHNSYEYDKSDSYRSDRPDTAHHNINQKKKNFRNKTVLMADSRDERDVVLFYS